MPRKTKERLATFDCTTCDQCVSVCPNAAMFTYPAAPVTFDYRDLIVTPEGALHAGPPRPFAINRDHQLACWDPWCNDCGNCATFCPELGGPSRVKPRFFASAADFAAAAPRPGLHVAYAGRTVRVDARLENGSFGLLLDTQGGAHRFHDGVVSVWMDPSDHEPTRLVDDAALPQQQHRMNLGMYHALRHIAAGVFDPRHLNPVRAAQAANSV
jgi:ferredoxin